MATTDVEPAEAGATAASRPAPPSAPPPSKRCLVWDWTNTRDRPSAIDQAFLPSASPDNHHQQQPFSSCHNWNAWAPPELKGRLPFRPMVRTPAQLEGGEWDVLLASCDAAGAAADSDNLVVHFLNEPDRAGITPAQAADLWTAKAVPELRVARHAKLVGPACASDSPGTAWLAVFMDLVVRAGSPPDYLGLHYYGADASAAKTYLTSMHALHGLPVSVPEIACTSRDPTEVARFTDELSRWMDATTWVAEYGFFGCMAHLADDFVSPAAQLMDADGKFTPLMRRLMRTEGSGDPS